MTRVAQLVTRPVAKLPLTDCFKPMLPLYLYVSLRGYAAAGSNMTLIEDKSYIT